MTDDIEKRIKRMEEREIEFFSAIDKLRKEREWQPIETAPRDGRSFLVHSFNNRCEYIVYREPESADSFRCWRNNDDLEKRLYIRFDRWMPLSPPPKGDE